MNHQETWHDQVGNHSKDHSHLWKVSENYGECLDKGTIKAWEKRDQAENE